MRRPLPFMQAQPEEESTPVFATHFDQKSQETSYSVFNAEYQNAAFFPRKDSYHPTLFGLVSVQSRPSAHSIRSQRGNLVRFTVRSSPLGIFIQLIFSDGNKAKQFLAKDLSPLLGYQISAAAYTAMIVSFSTFATSGVNRYLTPTEMRKVLDLISKQYPWTFSLMQRKASDFDCSVGQYTVVDNWIRCEEVKIQHKAISYDSEHSEFESLYLFIAAERSPIKSILISKATNDSPQLELDFANREDLKQFCENWNASTVAANIEQRTPGKSFGSFDDKLIPGYRYQDNEMKLLADESSCVPIKFTVGSIEQKAILSLLDWAASTYKLPAEIVSNIKDVVSADIPTLAHYQSVDQLTTEDQSEQRVSMSL